MRGWPADNEVVTRAIGKAACALALLGAGLSTTGCGAQEHATAVAAPSAKVVERDFRISAPKHLPAGEVHLVVRNRGPVSHELIVVRSGGQLLPLRADGLTVDEDAVEDRTALALEPGEPGVRTEDVSLSPGRYVMFCNMSGHFMGGMYADLDVG